MIVVVVINRLNMRLDSTKKDKDKIEITKQQQIEIQKVFDSRIKPKENHTLFEFDLKTKEIRLAKLEPESEEIHWNKAIKGDFSQKKIVIKKENCIYITALNKENVVKILKRDFGIVCL